MEVKCEAWVPNCTPHSGRKGLVSLKNVLGEGMKTINFIKSKLKYMSF